MRIGIVGAGGIGGYLAAQLIEAGQEVALVARGAHGAAIARDGLRFIAPEGVRVVRAALVSEDAAAAGVCDLVILAVKAHQLAGAIEAARPMLGPATQALTFQNGVEAPEMCAEAYGRERALIGVARIFVNITGPGEITLREGPRRFVVGDIDGRQEGRAAPVIAAFRAAGIDCPARADVRVELWEKFLLFNAVSSTTAGARTTMGVVREVPELWALFETLVRETEALARARGIPLPPDAVERALKAGRATPAGARSSTAHDLEMGRPLEIDWLCGAVARLSAEAGLEAPASRTVHALLAPWREGARP
ncbi:MAG: 2-dehydropantoate 2-reductase [Alphaproteobacteria bacterium]|nr:MAG: 2-dehydropantoate 2-reductase [Alphaproteobacteria bacterium]